MSSTSLLNHKQLVDNIRKTESLILDGKESSNSLNFSSDVANLWKDQVQQLKAAILKAYQDQITSPSDAEETSKHEEHPKKKSQSAALFDFATSHNIRFVMIFDIEGTITPLYFVTKILFPFFVEKCDEFVRKNLTEKILKIARVEIGGESLNEEQEKSSSSSSLTSLEKSMIEVASEFIKHSNTNIQDCDDLASFQNALIEDSLEHTRANRKIPYMKKLQGICWHQAYLDGSISGDLFSDFKPFIENFVAMKKKATSASLCTADHQIHIYSSGSIFAQQLLLRHSRFGDLTRDFDGFHDTVTAGMKFEPESYNKIYNTILDGESSQKQVCIFFSDSIQELKAAKTASALNVGACGNNRISFVPVLTVRPQNPKVGGNENEDDEQAITFPSIFTFLQVTEALFGDEDEKIVENYKIEKELSRIREDVKKYNASADGEERKIF